jgi:hypothetical protein
MVAGGMPEEALHNALFCHAIALYKVCLLIEERNAGPGTFIPPF